MDGDPWTFNNHLLVYHRLQLGEDPLRVPLHFVDYWIQVHDLSPGLMSEGMIKQSGAFLGTYIDYDAKPINIGGCLVGIRHLANFKVWRTLLFDNLPTLDISGKLVNNRIVLRGNNSLVNILSLLEEIRKVLQKLVKTPL
ncbi:hypothetical protein Gorai_009284, partial [Gossypium raimondii]|nr:hypothetical protein [Gossypium raimondii]